MANLQTIIKNYTNKLFSKNKKSCRQTLVECFCGKMDLTNDKFNTGTDEIYYLTCKNCHDCYYNPENLKKLKQWLKRIKE